MLGTPWKTSVKQELQRTTRPRASVIATGTGKSANISDTSWAGSIVIAAPSLDMKPPSLGVFSSFKLKDLNVRSGHLSRKQKPDQSLHMDFIGQAKHFLRSRLRGHSPAIPRWQRAKSYFRGSVRSRSRRLLVMSRAM